MKETRLGDFEETVLLLVGILEQDAYAFRIAAEFEAQLGRTPSIGSVHSTLSRLADKGFLRSEMGAPSPSRGGRRRRIYKLTASGQTALIRSRDVKLSLWRQFPPLASGL